MAPLSDEDKVIIRHYIEKKYTAYEIWKQNPEKNWHYSLVKRAVKKFKEHGTMERKKGSGRPRSARTAENESFVEEMICSHAHRKINLEHTLRQEKSLESLKSLIPQYAESLRIKASTNLSV